MHAKIHVRPYVAATSAAVAESPITAKHFVTFGESRTMIPDDAAALFTTDQEALLLDPDVPKRSFADSTNKDAVNYYASIYSAFYPEIQFYLDWANPRPNVFAFQEFGRKTVVIGGELLRLQPLYDNAMAIALAFGVGSLLGSNPADGTSGYTVPGQALYFGIGVVMRTAMQTGTLWNDTVSAGKGELTTVINALITKGPDTGSGPDRPALQCLLDVMNAALSGLELPTCAGGPTIGGLKLQSASYDTQLQQITVTYNQPVSAYSATNPKNYNVTPGKTAISTAVVDPDDAASVLLTGPLAAGNYTVAARNVRASDGSTLDLKTDSASFTVAAP